MRDDDDQDSPPTTSARLRGFPTQRPARRTCGRGSSGRSLTRSKWTRSSGATEPALLHFVIARPLIASGPVLVRAESWSMWSHAEGLIDAVVGGAFLWAVAWIYNYFRERIPRIKKKNDEDADLLMRSAAPDFIVIFVVEAIPFILTSFVGIINYLTWTEQHLENLITHVSDNWGNYVVFSMSIIFISLAVWFLVRFSFFLNRLMQAILRRDQGEISRLQELSNRLQQPESR